MRLYNSQARRVNTICTNRPEHRVCIRKARQLFITCLHAPPDFKETESAAGRGVVPRISLVLCVALMLVLVSVERMVERVCYAVNVLECVCVCVFLSEQ